MKLMTKEIEKRIPPIGTQDGKGDNAVVYAKFFTPDAQWTWYAMEYDKNSRVFFGLVIGHATELGYFSLDELERVEGPLGLQIERDKWFEPMTIGKIKKTMGGIRR